MHFNKGSLGFFLYTMLMHFMYLSAPPNVVEVLFYMQEPLLISDKE